MTLRAEPHNHALSRRLAESNRCWGAEHGVSVNAPEREDAAVRHWAGLAGYVARRFYFPGHDYDDVRQEALIALWQAQRSYDGTGDERGHLALCIHRRLSSKLKEARRLKHGPLNEALREPESHAKVGRWVEPGQSAVAPFSGFLSALFAPLMPTEQRAVLGVAMGYRNAELGPRTTVEKQLRRARRKLKEAA